MPRNVDVYPNKGWDCGVYVEVRRDENMYMWGGRWGDPCMVKVFKVWVTDPPKKRKWVKRNVKCG